MPRFECVPDSIDGRTVDLLNLSQDRWAKSSDYSCCVSGILPKTKYKDGLKANKSSLKRTNRNRNIDVPAHDERDAPSYQRELLAMRKKISNWTRMAVVVAVVAGTQSGCKSGWKMPGSDMFAWSRKPSEATLAGSSPSLSMPTTSSTASANTSPALRNTPNPLANSVASGNRPGSPYGATGSTGPSFNMPPNNPTANHVAGVSASANGYSTGPYSMAGNAQRPGGYAPASGYGGTQPGMTAPPPSGYGAPPAPSNAMAGLPPAYGGAGTGVPQTPSLSAYPTMASSNVPAMQAGFNPTMQAAATALPPPSNMPNAFPGAQQSNGHQAMSAQNYAGATPYRPGSVGRTTGYDFSAQGSGAVAGMQGLPPIMSMPPNHSMPQMNTANGQPNGPTFR